MIGKLRARPHRYRGVGHVLVADGKSIPLYGVRHNIQKLPVARYKGARGLLYLFVYGAYILRIDFVNQFLFASELLVQI